jgi:hypothetical protein
MDCEDICERSFLDFHCQLSACHACVAFPVSCFPCFTMAFQSASTERYPIATSPHYHTDAFKISAGCEILPRSQHLVVNQTFIPTSKLAMIAYPTAGKLALRL